MHHKRSLYRSGLDIAELVELYPSFAKHTAKGRKGRLTIKEWTLEAQRELTRHLMQKDFGITICLRSDRLCPPVPQRLNYLLWVEDLLLLSKDIERPGRNDHIKGIDIGTGASCIFPLIGNAAFSWRFSASEIDPVSLECAISNILCNNLESSIRIIEGSKEKLLHPILEATTDVFQFLVCNPPFFSSHDQAASHQSRELTITPSESSTDGGELGFVWKLFKESLEFKSRVKWFTSMIGKKTTLIALKGYLFKSERTKCIKTTTFTQGKQSRWGIAWTFDETVRNTIEKSVRGKKGSEPCDSKGNS